MNSPLIPHLAHPSRPCVLVLAGHDPSGGAGIHADLEAISAQGAHALSVITALTVQDNDRVYAVHPIDSEILRHQLKVLTAKIKISAVKTGIVANRKNAELIAELILHLRQKNPDLPYVLDPVLGSGHGDLLSVEDAVTAISPLLPLATLITPNLPEAQKLVSGMGTGMHSLEQQARYLMQGACHDVFIKGGHGTKALVENHWFHRAGSVHTAGSSEVQEENLRHQVWQWERLAGGFHGSGCTLAAALAAHLAQGRSLQQALELAQQFTQNALAKAYAVAGGQLIPQRH